MADPANYDPMNPRFIERIGNGDPAVNGLMRLAILFISAIAAIGLGVLSFLAANIYDDVHSLNSQMPVQVARSEAQGQHMANIDTNVAQMWQAIGDIRDRLSHLEGQDGSGRRR